MREVCNSFDDDCDGVIDNGTNLDLCGKTGLVCSQGACVPAGQAAQDASLSTAGPNGDASVSQVSSPPFDLGEPPHQTIVDGAVVSASAAAAPTESRAGCGLSNEPCSTTGGLSVGVAWFLLSVFRRARRTNGQRVSE